MAWAARFFTSMSTPAVSAERSARDRSAADMFITIVIFSMTGLLISLVALLLGWPVTPN